MSKQRKTYGNTNETIFNPVRTASILNAECSERTRKIGMCAVHTIIFVCVYFCHKIG